ncbi:uncharacterized protein BCR38DRAFT_445082 [Pseudomassariella vexata]|uniref:Uncharacterized protein n=1 Tax=Pseudomassariella vexata TaxID=1141098 RepID=A0A1Y2DKD9_9PEZI|nr:uncharacterized protein BCR38DRAFT_445082 [Pseudomassariella vexata]ORY59634.1 hypothetical protein BCR38DRAFT_445082 [Pseudomassariella vexata]
MAATGQGYDALTFTIKGPEAASVSLELQTQANCEANTTEYTSSYFTVDGLTGQTQTVSVPLSVWTDANLDAVVGIIFYGFSAGLTGTDKVWQMDNIILQCSTPGKRSDSQ